MHTEMQISATITHPLYSGAGLLSRKEAAKELGISLRNLCNRLSKGEIAATRIGGLVFIHRDEIRRYLCKQTSRRPVSYAERLKCAREFYGISQAMLAKECGVEPATVELMESGSPVDQADYALAMAMIVYLGELQIAV